MVELVLGVGVVGLGVGVVGLELGFPEVCASFALLPNDIPKDAASPAVLLGDA